MKAKIAIASKNGSDVDEHFGRATFFRIYEVTDEGRALLETRDVVAACQHAREHSKTDFDRVIDLVSDCDAMIVQRIGEGAAAYVISKGVRVFEANGPIDAVLDKLIEDGALQDDAPPQIPEGPREPACWGAAEKDAREG